MLAGIQVVVIRPELPLATGAAARLRSRERLIADPRIVAPHEFDLAGFDVGLDERGFDRPRELAASGALIASHAL